MKKAFLFICLIFSLTLVWGQEKQDSLQNVYVSESIDSIYLDNLQLNPMRASLYSAVLPGLGQVYNRKYWKVPLVWGLIGTGVGFSVYYNNQYKDLRGAYIAELNGEPHEYSGLLDAERLAQAQDDQRRYRDYAIALSILAYVLNVIDATVDAHLYEIRKDRDLSIDPQVSIDPVSQEPQMGIALKLKF